MELYLKNLDTESFINAIKTRPAIWDATAAEYHDLTKKRKSWIQVFREFCPEFDKSTNKYEISIKFMNKWRDIKELFLKLARSGRTLYYPYTQQLSFLHDGTTINKKFTIDDKIKDENPNQFKQKNLKSGQNLMKRKRARSKIREAGNDSRNWGRDFESLLMRRLSPIPLSTVNTFQNADRAFFESIMPSISDFTEDQKLEFRSEVLNVIMKIRKQQKNSENNSDDVSERNTESVSEYESS